VSKVPSGPRIDLTFNDGQIDGSAGCNGYGGTFQAIGGAITFGQIRTTQRACHKPVMAAETTYLRAFEGSTAYMASSTTLRLTGGAADLSFTASRAQ
jgi:heat shock protein HslJ